MTQDNEQIEIKHERLGVRVKRVRVDNRMTLTQVSFLTGVSVSTLHRIENGANTTIDTYNAIVENFFIDKYDTTYLHYKSKDGVAV